MSGIVEQGRVIQNRCIGSDVWEVIIHAPKQAAIVEVGQFCHVKVSAGTAPLLRRPISYAGFDRDAGTITLLYRVVGEGTRIMTTWRPGDMVDCLGPLGTTFSKKQHMMLVGGGVGIAPMVCMAANAPEGAVIDVVLGFRNKSEAFWAETFKGLPVTVHIATDDGSVGTKGYPTVVMETLLAKQSYDAVLTCGPTPMMKGVAKVAAAHNVYCEVSLEERMGCGTGGCLGCGCDGRDGKRYKVCKDGPVFPAKEVGYDG